MSVPAEKIKEDVEGEAIEVVFHESNRGYTPQEVQEIGDKLASSEPSDSVFNYLPEELFYEGDDIEKIFEGIVNFYTGVGQVVALAVVARLSFFVTKKR